MKNRTIKSFKEKYGFGTPCGEWVFDNNISLENNFNNVPYIGYLYIPMDLTSEISGYLSEADDRNCKQIHLDGMIKTKVIGVEEDKVLICFINYHMNNVMYLFFLIDGYKIKGNVLIKE